MRSVSIIDMRYFCNGFASFLTFSGSSIKALELGTLYMFHVRKLNLECHVFLRIIDNERSTSALWFSNILLIKVIRVSISVFQRRKWPRVPCSAARLLDTLGSINLEVFTWTDDRFLTQRAKKLSNLLIPVLALVIFLEFFRSRTAVSQRFSAGNFLSPI